MIVAVTSRHDAVKMASVNYSELRIAAKAFKECDPAYRPQYSGYCHASRSLEMDTKKEEQGEGPVMMLKHYIKPATKRRLEDKQCIRFHRKQFHVIIKKLKFVPMTGNRQPLTVLHHLKIWPG